MRVKLMTGVVGAALAVAIAPIAASSAGAAPAGAESDTQAESQSHRSKGDSVLTIEPTTLTALDAGGIRHYPILTDKSTDGATTYTFEIAGDPADGTVELFGGIKFYRDGNCVILWGVVIDSQSGTVSASVNGERVDLFRQGANNPEGLSWHLTTAGATALNEGLDVTVFRPARIIGYNAVTLDAS